MGTKTFTLRLSEEQLEEVSEKAQELGISKNDYIKKLIDGDVYGSAANEILKELHDIKTMLKKN